MRDSLEAYLVFTDEQWSDLEDVAADLELTRPQLFSTAILEYVARHRRR